MIHGRFQPFHNGHLEYLLAAAARCDGLLVGLASGDDLESDPFTDAERVRMLEAVLDDLDLRRRTRLVRFSIEEAAIPEGTIHYLRVFDAREALHAERLTQAGFGVVVLHHGRPKTVTGAQVRALLRAGGGWERLVPRAVARVLLSLPASRVCELGLYGVRPQSSR